MVAGLQNSMVFLLIIKGFKITPVRILLKAKDVMLGFEEATTVSKDISAKDAIVSMSRKGLSIVAALHGNKTIVGIMADCDLRKLLENNEVRSLTFERSIRASEIKQKQ